LKEKLKSITRKLAYIGVAFLVLVGVGTITNSLPSKIIAQTGTAPNVGGVTASGNYFVGLFNATGGMTPVSSSNPYTAFTTLNPPFNLVAPAAVTDTVAQYSSQIYIPYNTTLTGACLLNGATVTTDKHLVYLANAAGTIIATSALAGVADTGNASSYQCQAFIAPVAVFGPQTYWVGTQPNGTTDNFYTYTAKGAPTNYGTLLTTSAVFGTVVNIVPTTTFTTAVGPLMMVY
jgi:hypothetical protein